MSQFLRMPNIYLQSTLIWLLIMAVMCINCFLFLIVEQSPVYSSFDVLSWPFVEWGIWLLIMPVTLKLLSSRTALFKPTYLIKIGLATLLLSLLLKSGLDYWLQSHSLSHTLFFYWPKYLVATLLIFAFFWFKEVRLGNSDEPTSKDKSVLQHQSRQESIMITSLEGDVTIPCEEITYINAAGNYMEIVTSSKTYLLRKTLKQLEQTLPLNSFFRCHRSYIVNLNAINKIQNLDAGHGEIHLKSGNTIPVSKSQRTGLKQAFATLTS